MTRTDSASRLLRRVHRAADGLAADLGLYGVSTAFAGLTAATSTLPAHRAWGSIAVIGYALATTVTLAQLVAAARRRSGGRPGRWTGAPGRWAVLAVGWLGTTLLPLLVQAVQRAGGAPDRAQDEVVVVEAAGARLLDTGSPYLSHAGIEAALPHLGYLAYVPYQPGMALFGLPRRVFGAHWWTDARIGFALVTAVTVLVAIRLLWGRVPGPPLIRAAQVVAALPVCALTLATGGDDLPVLGLTLLALALATRERWTGAGFAAGAAGSLKLFGWPVLVILGVYVLLRWLRPAAGTTRSRADAVRYLLPALGLPVLTLLPVLVARPDGVLENLIRYPLGLGLAGSPAASNFPGHVLAETVPGGRVLAAILLAAAALAIGVHLVLQPPRDAGAVAWRAAIAMLAAILLAPASRFGYLLYPAAYAVWAVALSRATPRPEPERADAAGAAAGATDDRGGSSPTVPVSR